MRKAGWRLKFAPVGEIIHHGGGSVKKLNYRRDIMLSEATVRLHRKNGGPIAALLAFIVLGAFNYSRAIVWSLLSIVQPSCNDRARHFRGVSRHMLDVWPK
jgi:GT2 family glycosyltransferase